jgi:ectoine hydroxylase-related dioxygenase (phytanoyl-CoA dioxygenase family)
MRDVGWDGWTDNSYVVAPGLFADRIGDIGRWVDEVAAWPRDDARWLTNYEKANPSQLARRENFVPYHEGLARLLMGPETLALVARLVRGPVVLYKDRINFKYPGGGAFGPHQDSVAFDRTAEPHVTLLVSVDAAGPDNGCLEFAAGWSVDRRDVLPLWAPHADLPGYREIAPEAAATLAWTPVPTEPGDAVLFTSFVPHRSGPNRSAAPRRVIYAVYNAAREGDLRSGYFAKKRAAPNSAQYFVGNPFATVTRG